MLSFGIKKSVGGSDKERKLGSCGDKQGEEQVEEALETERHLREVFSGGGKRNDGDAK
jgi:hypothetical protein